MKKIRFVIMFILVMLIILVSKNIYALSNEDATKLIYQDITINKDGSMTVIEAAWLNGTYNGRWRTIEFKSEFPTTFTGTYSNFAGGTDIYDGSEIKNVEVYDISQSNFKSIYDIKNKEHTYSRVNDAQNGKYGVYVYSKYTIADAVVVHNDIAELYWNVIGNSFEEDIQDFQVLVHLPGEDSDVRIWTHGPLTGTNKIIDSKTLYFKDYNVDNYTAETIRVMFNKNLVPSATKKSKVDGKENILKYENMMANNANAERENEKLQLENKANQEILNLEKYESIYNYNTALELVNQLDNTNENKQGYLDRIYAMKQRVNAKWKESIESSIICFEQDNYITLNRREVERLKEKVNDGFDEQAKIDFYEEISKLEQILDRRDTTTRIICISIVSMFYIILAVPVIYELVKIILEKYVYKGQYYRDFPSDIEPYVLEYLMKRKITNLSFSATIISLIEKKVIRCEKNPEDEKDINLILENSEYVGTNAENTVLKTLFKIVAEKENICSTKRLKKYGNTTANAKCLINKIDKFKKEAKKEAEREEYFKGNGLKITLMVLLNINYIFSLFMTIGAFYGKPSVAGIFIYLAIVTMISLIFFIVVNLDKNRSQKGKEEYSKWLAHKRFLKDFGSFDEKDLPETILWEKYLVTATVLGCADKIQNRMKLNIANINDTNNAYIDSNLLLFVSMNNNFVRDLNRSVNSAVSTANMQIASSESSSGGFSSGGGFGGGSSGGGGFGGGGGRRRSLLKIIALGNKYPSAIILSLIILVFLVFFVILVF